MNTWQRLFPTNERVRTEMFVDTSPLNDEVEFTYMENPQSFGHEFNLIRAVGEYGPQRIASITKLLTDLEAEMIALRQERATLEQLVAVVKPTP
jgi:hypothetical protein